MSFSLVFHDAAPTELHPLSLHDALPISAPRGAPGGAALPRGPRVLWRHERDGHGAGVRGGAARRSAADRVRLVILGEIGRHTSELQSPDHLVCRLLLEKKKKKRKQRNLE